MTTGMLEGVIKKMVNKFPDSSADEIITAMKNQPESTQLFDLMKKIGLTEDKFKEMIDEEVKLRKQ